MTQDQGNAQTLTKQDPAKLAQEFSSFDHYPPEENWRDGVCIRCTFPVDAHQGMFATGGGIGGTWGAHLHRGCAAEVWAAQVASGRARPRSVTEEDANPPTIQTHTDPGPTRQIVYRYPSGPSGTGRFAVWHAGADVLTVYRPEGQVLEVLPVPARNEAGAETAAALAGTLESRHYSENIYPRQEG